MPSENINFLLATHDLACLITISSCSDVPMTFRGRLQLKEHDTPELSHDC